ncbi:Uncharacterized protein APZ42_026525 [Daphnia magna]|uniref:Uncharacterized protein n=1 Tax=Daphnia magna TaxID=35525 RepID=A0A164SA85_9CRUS|nr:Uncharacterized protein APZ42_026525 [Daphnia magna]
MCTLPFSLYGTFGYVIYEIMTGELSLAAVLRMVLGVWPSDLG